MPSSFFVFFLGSKLFLYFVLLKRLFCFSVCPYCLWLESNCVKGLKSFISTANFASLGNVWETIIIWFLHFSQSLIFKTVLSVQLLLFTKVQAILTVKSWPHFLTKKEFWKRQVRIITAVVLWHWIMPLLVGLTISLEVNVKYFAVSTWLVPKRKIYFY